MTPPKKHEQLMSSLLVKTRRQDPVAGGSTHFRYRTEINQAGTELDASSPLDRVLVSEGLPKLLWEAGKGLSSLTQLCSLSTIEPTELPGKTCPLGPSGTVVLEMTNCFLIGLEAHCTGRNTYLVLRSGQKTTYVEVICHNTEPKEHEAKQPSRGLHLNKWVKV